MERIAAWIIIVSTAITVLAWLAMMAAVLIPKFKAKRAARHRAEYIDDVFADLERDRERIEEEFYL